MNFDLLKRTVALAKRARRVFPNPRVGCVIVKKGKVIAKGWHKEFGGSHAEVVALDMLPKDAARGSMVYVSLEPCAYWKGKKTPSCAKRLTREGVAAVVVGMRDPNPHVAGKGIAVLERAGIKVVVAPPRVAVYDLNHEYLMRIAGESGERPFVFLKTAMSVDGKIGTSDHRSIALSTPEDRRAVDRLRAQCDAIMVGGTTLRNDKPRLTVKDSALVRERLREGRDAQPLRVAVAGGVLLVGNDRYVVGKKRVDPVRSRPPTAVGVTTGTSGRLASNGVDLARALSILAIRYGVRVLMLEGGGELNAAMLAGGYVDLLRVATASIILGGRGAPTLVDGEGFLPPISLQLFEREKKGVMDIAWYCPVY
ncbi:MAG: bifunctional diaminohydroxyphosphoribosylaminopyrimidine deaminase/5-amino-6-(5-phosphoribosylamino)uracil reductase RibD [bacterium]|nr:bifunctional diaminohydroxyphosphoribosylaminopyrimidine deaminase/5-amino-6-(5-phosphoribosylamino)uracil reductase RibD [bacterium]